ncbi:MAG TPA: hypothetical protein VHA33_06540 [Candidatus Angelobacter sp.]|nr:hypothetical protein [Candidatus Angelobacter sp.]
MLGAVEQAARDQARRMEAAVAKAAEDHRETTANAWKLTSKARSDRALSLFESRMYDDAFRLALEAVAPQGGDPGNIDGFFVAAACLHAQGRSQEARQYIEKQIKLLSSPDYRGDVVPFERVLGGLPGDLLQMFCDALNTNLGYWSASTSSVDVAAGIGEKLLSRRRPAACRVVFGWIMESRYFASPRALRLMRRLEKELVDAELTTEAVQIAERFSSMTDCLLDQAYLMDICALLGRDTTQSLISFTQSLHVLEARKTERELARLKELYGQKELTSGTLTRVMDAVSARYAQWKPELEKTVYDGVLAGVRGNGWIVGLIGFLPLLILGQFGSALRHSRGDEVTNALLVLGTALGVVIVSILGGKTIRRFKMRGKARIHLEAAFAERNRIFQELGLPQIKPLQFKGLSPLATLVLYSTLVAVYVVAWISLLSGSFEP